MVNKKGIYSVTVAANGCDTTGKITVNYTTKPVVNLGNDTTLCNTEQLLLDAAYSQSSYLWQDGSTGATYAVGKGGLYFVDVSNICGSAKDSITVQYQACACEFYIPSAFTPNGDGKNDVFKPSYKCLFTNYRLNIFNRYGQRMFVSQNADIGWDGTSGGQQEQSGVYVWEISYTDTLTGKMVKKTGTVVLVR
jgi:gliding motility-associated-like protein